MSVLTAIKSYRFGPISALIVVLVCVAVVLVVFDQYAVNQHHTHMMGLELAVLGCMAGILLLGLALKRPVVVALAAIVRPRVERTYRLKPRQKPVQYN